MAVSKMHVAKIMFRTLLYGGLLGWGLSLLLAYYCGYRNIDPAYGGSYFYNWRIDFVDKDLSKSYFKPNKRNEQINDPIFNDYCDLVQGISPKHGLRRNWKPFTNGAARQRLPFYAHGYPDPLLFGAKKTWKLFHKKEHQYRLQREIDYLGLRADFIEAIFKDELTNGGKTPDMLGELRAKAAKGKGGKTPVDFVESLVSTGYFDNTEHSNALTEISQFFKKPANSKLVNLKDVLTVINKILTKKPADGYFVKMSSTGASLPNELKADLRRIVDQIFPTPEYKITDQDMADFFLRLAQIKINQFDAHILNRIYSYLRMVFSYVEIPEATRSEPLKKLTKEWRDKKAECDKLAASDTNKERLKRKVGTLYKKLMMLRTEMVYNKISMLMASLLGEKGPVIGKADDKRNFLVAWVSPKLAKKGSLEKREYLEDTAFLNNQIVELIREMGVAR